MDLELRDDNVLVTASSSGLGKASAKAFAREGANVMVNGRDEKRLDEAIAEIREEAQGDVQGVVGDLTNATQIETIVDETISQFGGMDHLITNAGGPPSGPFLDTDDDDWYLAFDLLVMSVVRLVREAEAHLRDGGGCIVNITSHSVKAALDSLVLSNAVRMSVVGLEKTLSNELAPEVRSNAVLPGTHETPRIEELITSAVERGEYPGYAEGLKARSEGIPMQCLGDPREFGEFVAFLSSPRACHINGQAIVIDGGGIRSNL